MTSSLGGHISEKHPRSTYRATNEHPVTNRDIGMSTEIIYLAGRYNKYRRDISQSPWIDKDDVRVKDSVQEMIETGLKTFLEFEKSIFESCGREDVDVRMLGDGRPFALKLHKPRHLDNFKPPTFRSIESVVNSKCKGVISIRDLQLVTKYDVANYISAVQETKKKEYRALCCCSRKLTSGDFDKINGITTEICLNQKTPIRVLHRRTLCTRQRTVHKIKIEPVKLGDYESVKQEYLDRLFTVDLLTEAGTYIKEFVHSDFGRTQPNLASLLGDCETDIMELDVVKVHSDWPPPISSEDEQESTMADSQTHQEFKAECDEDDLEYLYDSGQKTYEEALTKERGDAKENLLATARKVFEKADDLVGGLELFSYNETVDDIPTRHLKYLLVPAFLAKVWIAGDIGSRRLQAFSRAENYIRQYLVRLAAYKIDTDRVTAALKTFDDPVEILQSKTLEDCARRRQEKIEKYNSEQELKAKLLELERRCNREQDDETARELNIILIKKWTRDIIDDLEGIVKPALMFERGSSESQGAKTTMSPSAVRPTKSGNTSVKNLVITKETLRKQAFGTGYPSLPSVSVDQFITKKINDGSLAFDRDKQIYSNSLQRYAEQPDLLRQQEEQSDEEREAKEEQDDQDEIVRKRRWDEFKDDNPRGSGNRHNMG